MPIEIVLAGVVLLLGAPLLWLWSGRHRLLREHSELTLTLDDQRLALQKLGQERLLAEQDALQARQQIQALQKGLSEARSHERRAERLDEERRELLSRTARQEAQQRSLQEQLQLLARAAGRHEEDSSAARQDLVRLQETAADASRRYQRASLALGLLGWPRWADPQPARPALAPQERALSQAILDRLQSRPGVDDVVLADTTGCALLGSGEPRAVDRFASLGALAGGLWPILERLLGQEVVLLRLSSAARGLHLTPVQPHWLVAHGAPRLPSHDLFSARMTLSGSLCSPESPVSGPTQPPLSRGEDAALRRRLQGFVAERGLEAALYDSRGEVLAATGTGAPRLRAFLEVWPAWALRLAWMGWLPDALSLRALGFAQDHLLLQTLPAGSGAALLLLRGASLPSEDDLDDFIQKLRWENLRATSSAPSPSPSSRHEGHPHG